MNKDRNLGVCRWSKDGRRKVVRKKLAELRGYLQPEVHLVEDALDGIFNTWRHKRPSIFRTDLTWQEFAEFREDIKRWMLFVCYRTDLRGRFAEKERALLSYRLGKIKAECESRKLPKGETVDRKTKHDIAPKVGMKPGKFSDFKSGRPVYHQISKALADNGYKRKPSRS